MIHTHCKSVSKSHKSRTTSYFADALVDRVARFAGVFSFAGVLAFFAGASATAALRFAGAFAGAFVSSGVCSEVAFAAARFAVVFFVFFAPFVFFAAA